MTEYDDRNSGAIFRNEDRQNDRQPTHRGFLNVDGREYWVSAWVKEAGPNSKKPGQKFFSLSIQPKDQQQAAPDSPMGEEFDDDIPF